MNIKIKIVAWIIIVLSLSSVAILSHGFIHAKIYPYVSGKTGKRCYMNDYHHGNIKDMRYYKTLEVCEEYVKRNQ